MNTFFKKVIFAAQLVLIALISFSSGQAAGEVDATFNAAVQETTLGNVLTVVPQPDGKLLVGGNFSVAGNFGRANVALLNADGTVDPTFAPPDFYKQITASTVLTLRNINVFALARQADGKVLVGGDFYQVGNQIKPGLARLNADGSLDASFSPPIGLNGQPFIYDIKIQPDNKIVFSGNFVSSQNGVDRSGIARLNPDGTFDTAFSGQFGTVYSFVIQSDGKIVFGNSNTNLANVRRINSDGTADNSYLNSTYSAANISNLVYIFKLALQADGKVIVAGQFNVDGSPLKNIVRINTNGALDPSFNVSGNGADFEVRSLAILTDGKIVIGGVFTAYNSVFRLRNARLNADGTLDTTFSYNPGNSSVVYAAAAVSDGGFILGDSGDQFSTQSRDKLTKFNANGSLDATFQGAVYQRGIVNQVAAQADGKVLIGGVFKKVNGVAKQNIARLNADGSLDTNFVVNITGRIAAVAVQADGKVLVGGEFMGVNNTSRSYVARLNADGTLDTSFQSSLTFLAATSVERIIILPDGKILIAGQFKLSNYNFVLNVARLNSDGSTDTTFAQSPVNSPGIARAMKIQTDGKIVVGGSFTQLAGANRGNIARLNADGTLDTTFNPSSGAAGNVFDLAIQSNGSIVIGGDFLSVNGSPVGSTAYIARLLPDGSRDASFVGAANNFVFALERQADDKILVGGIFSQLNSISRFGIARLNANGTFDNSFAGTGTNDAVRTIAFQTDNKILIGGEFTRVNETTRNVSVARLLNTPTAVRTRFDFDGDGRADIATFRPSNGNWYQLRSANNAFNAVTFGQSGDRIAPADYDGDGKTDIAVFRDTVPGAGNFAYFYILNSADNSFRPVQFGATGDVPVSGDWDGDGKADLAVYREGAQTGGQSYFYYRPSSQPGVNFNQILWGGAGDKPLVGDFDGDGRLDAAVFRPATAAWYVLQSSNNQVAATNFGVGTDIPVPADYDGDGKANIAVFRPSTGTWFTSTNAAVNYGAIPFGQNGDLPVPADYDGDGRADVAVYRPSTGAWYLQRSTQGFTGIAFGDVNDKPIPNAYIR